MHFVRALDFTNNLLLFLELLICGVFSFFRLVAVYFDRKKKYCIFENDITIICLFFECLFLNFLHYLIIPKSLNSKARYYQVPRLISGATLD